MTNIIKLPVSKSIGARFLTASFFAGTLSGCPRYDDCDDLIVIREALDTLASARRIQGTDAETEPAVVDIHASGTAFRFMAAAAASTPGVEVILTGTPRLCSRPMTPLLEVLRQAGAEIEALGDNNVGPYKIKGNRLKGGKYEIRGDVSSQFISALMLASPTCDGGMILHFTTPLVSRPYAEMTARVMRDFGINVELSEEGVEVKEGIYNAPENYIVEADWSAAGFMYEAACLIREPIKIADLVSPGRSMQGDARTADIYTQLGISSLFSSWGAEIGRDSESPEELTLDMTDYPDLVPALSLSCAFNGCQFRFTGVRNLRLKESDRLSAIQRELRKFGFIVNVGEDSIEWQGEMTVAEEDFVTDTYDDHRIAMAFAIGALSRGCVKIANPDVVEKSFAGFWDQLPKLGLSCKRVDDVMIVTHQQSPA